MKLPSLISIQSAALSVSAILVSGAGAATIVQKQTFDLTDGELNLSFNGFDTTYGALASVQIELTYDRTAGYLGVDNESASAATVSFTHTTRFYVDTDTLVLDWSRLNGGTRLLAESLNRTTSTMANQTVQADSDVAPDYAGSDYMQYNLATTTTTSNGYFSNISQFNNKASFSVPVTVSQSNSISGLGGSAQNYLPANLAGSMTLTYTYTPVAPVPEPSTVLLSVIALSGATLVRRRERSVTRS